VVNVDSFKHKIGEIISNNIKRVENNKKYLEEIDKNKKFMDDNFFLYL